jgi:16S rRNA G966 N2-methylase RsmD
MMEFHPIANIFPLLMGPEYQELVEDVRQNGLLESIWLYEDKILDGRNRYRACVDIGIEPSFSQWQSECGSPVNFVIAMNLHRRHLDSSQRAACSVEALPFYEVEARKRQEESRRQARQQLDNNEGGNNSTTIIVKSRDQVAQVFSTNGRYVQDAKKLAKEEPELFERVKEGKLTIPQAKKKQKRDQREKRRQALANQPVIDDPTIWHGDFRELGSDIPDNSVDLIFTDPPYDEKNIPLYGDLAELGARVLKPGGSLICYVGHYALPDVLPLMTPHLRYWWTLACVHSGNAARLQVKSVYAGWKPMLWFVKEYHRNLDYVTDLVKSQPVDKTDHEWEQSSVEAEYYIEHLTLPDEMILDPMCGSGTTCLAALKLNRHTLGIEEDVERFRVAQARLSEYQAGA